MTEISDKLTAEDIQQVKDAVNAIFDAQQGPATAVSLYSIGQNSKLFYCVAAVAGHAINVLSHEDKLTPAQERTMGAMLIRAQYAVATGQA